MSSFWSWYIIILVLINVVGSIFILLRMRMMPKDDVASGERREHKFDGIEEYNNPLPRWWMWLFWLTIVFTIIYLFLYPGLGSYKGYYGWTQEGQWQKQITDADKHYAPLFEKFAKTPIVELAKQPDAMQMAQRIFINNCAGCHGPNAQGAKGFPNLTINVWRFGGTPEALETTIANGRNALMPPMAAGIGGSEMVPAVANYVRKLSKQTYDAALASKGETPFKNVCSACHGVDGTGIPAMGAPNLTTGSFLFGGELNDIEYTITNGRHSEMPGHEALLGPQKVHLLAAYVYYLSNVKK